MCHASRLREAVRELQGVEDPFYLAVVLAAVVVDSQQELVDEHGGGELGTVVVDAAMPDTIFQFK